MNILIVSYYQVYPLTTGAAIAQLATLEYLSNVCNISLLISEKFSLPQKELDALKAKFPKVKIYNSDGFSVLDNNQKIKNINIGYRLISALLNLLRQLKKYLKDRLVHDNLDRKDVSLEEQFESFFTPSQFYTHHKKTIDTIDWIIKENKINIVQIEFFENLNLVTAIPKSVKKLFICHESRFARIQSHIKAKNISSSFTDYVLDLNKIIELSFLEKFDSILSFSEYDTSEIEESLQGKINKPSLATIPFPVLDQDFFELDVNNIEPINKLVFIGAEEHFPNKDAVEWFIDEVASEIFLRYGLQLCVVGTWSKETILKYQNHPSNVYFTGFVDDISTILKNSISIAPIRIGGGLKTKILVAMAQGIPVISTKFAANGINVKHRESIMLAEEKDSFCNAVQYYIEDSLRTFAICTQAQNILRAQYSQKAIAQLRYDFYQDCLRKVN
jgi:hypothetical protein